MTLHFLISSKCRPCLYIVLAIALVITATGTRIGGTYSGSSNVQKAVLIDFDINVDGGALVFWERIFKEYRGEVLVLRINSYGGYLSVADKIVSYILEKGVVCYTWIPPGGHAVSAAAMVALACERVFMGSGSVIGDAIPVPSDPKTVEYVASRFRALAERMFKDKEELVKIAEAMVREGKTLTADEAVNIGFASSAERIEDLEKTLNIRVVNRVSPTAWDRFVSVLSLPIIAELLLFVGLILIVIEVLTTGFQGYAIAGALSIALALYGMNIISPNLFALILTLVGVVLLAIEIYTPGFGLFGLSGILLLAVGIGYQLYLTPPQLLTDPVYAAIGGLIVLISIACFIAYKAVQTARRKRTTLEQQLLASIGIAKTNIQETEPGVVYILNEDWTAYSVKGLIPAGSRVKVVRVEGLKLYVEKVEQE